VDLVAAVLWCRALGSFYYAGANFIGRSVELPEVAVSDP
jgi:hypothetical protein